MSSRFIPIEKADLEWKADLPYSSKFQDIYFSKENGLAESQHVFIDGNQLIDRWQQMAEDNINTFVIAETGFGSGLNFLLTCKLWLQHAPADACLRYISCEKHPLSKEDLIASLSLWPELDELTRLFIENYPVLTPGYHQIYLLNGRVSLTLMLGDVTDCYQQLIICGEAKLESQLRPVSVDAWYLDGFAPAKNEQMWTVELFQLIALLSKPGTTLATFSAAKSVKDNLKSNGFSFAKRKGYGRKRDMISARFEDSSVCSYRKKTTPWHQPAPLRIKDKSVIVIGAGLAGCFSAYSLAQKGWTVTLLDENKAVAMGASAIPQGVLFPKFSAYNSPLTLFMLKSFLYSSQFYKQIAQNTDFCHLNGALLLAYNSKEVASQAAMKVWLEHYPELARLVDKEQASKLAGIPLAYGGLYLPDSGWIDSASLCRWLINRKNINFFPETSIETLKYENELWHAGNHRAEKVVIANSYQARNYCQSDWLSIKAIRGQMSSIDASEESSKLQLPVCARGHILPAMDGRHWLGASYDLGQEHHQIKAEDDRDNLCNLKNYASQVRWPDKVINSWAQARATTPDYLPLVGAVVNRDSFNNHYSKFEANANLWIGDVADYYPGLYLCAAFGSRGLSTIPLAAEYLACEINQEVSILPRSLIQAISPSRFLKKALSRSRTVSVR